jgi:NAD(P)-dependent dehydrogenase (short-subunit alcohol dehydrogenase family)
MADVRGGVTLVTGGGRGIGRAIAQRLASDGMRVAVAARTQSEVENVASAIGGVALVLDVTDREAVTSAVDRVERELGPIDLLVNNAGVLERGGPAWERQPDEWWRVFEVNVLGSFLPMRAVLPRMIDRRRGRVVNLGSQSAYTRIDESPTYSAYMGSKAALARITEALAHDARSHGVFVFAVRPGSVRTAITDQMLTELGDAAADIPADVWTRPEQAADLVAFIATGALDALSGRHIDAQVDDWRALPARTNEILRDDLLALRLRR